MAAGAGIRSDRRQQTRGFSLVELFIAIVFLVIIVGGLGGVMLNVQRDYMAQRQLIEAQSNARVTMEKLVTFVRMAGSNPHGMMFEAIDPDPDKNAKLDSIRLRGDWNPPDGDLEDRYEDIILSSNEGILYKKEPHFEGDVTEFTNSLGSLSFSYRDVDNSPISDPIDNTDAIVFVDIELRTEVGGMPDTILESSATMRIREE